MTDPCPGRCNSGVRRATAAYEAAIAQWRLDSGEEPPEPPKMRPWPGEPIWCSACSATLSLCLADLEELIDLRVKMTDGFQSAGEQMLGKVHGKKQSAGSPSPGIDDMDDALRWLYGWEDALRKERSWPARPYRGVNAPAVTTTLAWLGPRLVLMLAHPDLAEPFGLELLHEHGRLQRLTSTKPPLTHKPLPCPGREAGGQPCRRRSLFLHEDGMIRCSNHNCRRVLTEEEYAGLEEQADQQVAS